MIITQQERFLLDVIHLYTQHIHRIDVAHALMSRMQTLICGPTSPHPIPTPLNPIFTPPHPTFSPPALSYDAERNELRKLIKELKRSVADEEHKRHDLEHDIEGMCVWGGRYVGVWDTGCGFPEGIAW